MTERPLEPSTTTYTPPGWDAPDPRPWGPFRTSLGVTLLQLRRSDAFVALQRGPWLAFIAIACHWHGRPEAWPSQATIAQFSGYSLRAIRDAVGELDRLGLVRVRRQRDAWGAERIDYAPGPVTLAAVAVFGRRSEPPATNASPPAAVAAPPAMLAAGSNADANAQRSEIAEARESPAGIADGGRQGLPPNLRNKKNLLLLEPHAADPSPTDEDRTVARQALAECLRRQHPDCAPARLYDRADVEQVAFCAAAIDGDAQTKLRALQDSLTGALRTSKGAPPTVRYIWGRIEHFLRHAERGRRIRCAAERRAQTRAQPPTLPDASTTPQPGLSRDQMATDLEKLFGPTWRARS